MSRKHNAGRFLRSTMLTGVAAASALPAFAQDGEADDTILVTGTRIQRADLQAPSPVTTVNSEQLLLTNTVNSEEFLNTLPQVIPSFDQTSNNPGDGRALVSLRGLGAVRTLVLVNGQRYVSASATSSVDINNIPASLVERIDLVTGGASAVYGSDAVAGVVNFILKDDFEGIQLDVSNELSAQEWDGNVFNSSITMGGNFADGRGNAVVHLSYTNRTDVLQGERGFSEVAFFDPGAGNEALGFINGGSSNIPGTRFRGLTSSNFNGGVNGALDADCATVSCSGAWIDDNGVIQGFRNSFSDPGNDFFNYAPFNYLQLPQERYTISAMGSFEINDWMEAYARGIYANNVVDSQLAPTPAGINYTINLDNPTIPAPLLALIAGDAGSNNGDGTATFRTARRYLEIGNRNSLRETSSFQQVVGLRGNINEQWSYDTFFNFSRSTVLQLQTGNLSRSAAQLAVLCDPGPTGSALPQCAGVPYADIFNGPGSLSPDAATFISRTGAQNDAIEQIQWVGTVSGDLDGIKTPWADAGAAVVVGLEYRENVAESVPDSVLGPDVAGFNASLPVGGRFDAYEAFAELQMPLVTGAPGFESLSLNGAYRYSDYSIEKVGSTHTFAVGLDWEVFPEFRLRGQFQRAVRAPNIAELFSAATNGFPSAQDPCSTGTGIQSVCTATGVPAAAFGGGFQSNAQIEGLFGGNPDLFEETAETFTVGMVWQPEQVDGLSIQVDYYNIEVQDAIQTVPLQTLLDECYIQDVSSSCNVFFGARNPATGEISAPFLPNLGSVNIATLKREGIDANVSYSFDADQVGMPADWGSFTMQYYGTYTLTAGQQTSATSSFVDCAGRFGLGCNPTEPTPEYKHTMQMSWLNGPMTASLRWRLIGGTDFSEASEAVGISALSSTIDTKNYLDATLQYAVNENLDLTVGVQNLTDTDLPIIASISEQANTFPGTYETLGRKLFFGATVRF